MNEISVALSKEYLERFGSIAHHNIDKALLAAGEVESRFGGGTVKKPMLLVIGDRAVYSIEGVDIPVNDIVLSTTKKWFEENLRFVDPDEHVKYQIELKQGSAPLVDIFKRKGYVLGANDTSAAVGYAPLTKTERVVLNTEKYLNSKDFKKRFPESGEDIKVMGLRRNDPNADSELYLTVAMAMVDRFVGSEEAYFRKKEEMIEELREFVESNYDFDSVNYYLNTLDRRGRGLDGIYLTVLGTSADGADCGQVGRGNRVSGIIPLNRPTCSEAAAGKNPVSHVGKIYNLLSYRIASRVWEKVPGLEEVYIWLLSQIGNPIDQPMIAAAQVVLDDNTSIKSVYKNVEEVLYSELGDIGSFCMDLVMGKIPVC